MVHMFNKNCVKNTLKSIILSVLMTGSLASLAQSQQSALLDALESRKAVVAVKAVRVEAQLSPNASARVNPKTGKIMVARKAIAAELEKDGTGVIINQGGFIVTNFHIIKGAHRLGVTLFDGTKVGATILHFMPEHDLALLKITPPYPLTPILFANSNSVHLGQEILHIGNSAFLNKTISGGIITGIGKNYFKNIKAPQTVELIRININVYKGDSGGPVLDKNGELIGIIVAKQQNVRRAAFAIPSNKIKELVLDFIN